MNIQDLTNFLLSKGCQLKGCSSKQIEKIESCYNLTLPQVYKDFLWYMGEGADKFMRGSSVFYNEIFDLKEDAIHLLNDDGLKFPDNAFVFWMHQGYQFAFFYVNQENDPPVYFYLEGSGKIVDDEPSLTKFFENQLIASGLEP